jgi:hypothetical protein
MSGSGSSQIHRPVLAWAGGYWGWRAGLATAAAILLYLVDRPDEPENGGTALGYALGVAGLGLICWLAWFGIRKRQFGPGRRPLEAWLSAHIYLGLALIVVATLHTGFRWHGNIHTLAFVLMVLVIASGIFGLLIYLRYPVRAAANLGGADRRKLVGEIVALDLECREKALEFDDRALALVRAATGAVQPAPGWSDLVRSRPVLSASTEAAIAHLRGLLRGEAALPPDVVLPLVLALTRRATLVERARRDFRYRLLLTGWRSVHLVLSIGLLVALVVHVVVVFYDW